MAHDVTVVGFAGKLAGLLGSSPGLTGTARAQNRLRQAFICTHSTVMPQPEGLDYGAYEKFDDEGSPTDESPP